MGESGGENEIEDQDDVVEYGTRSIVCAESAVMAHAGARVPLPPHRPTRPGPPSALENPNKRRHQNSGNVRITINQMHEAQRPG